MTAIAQQSRVKICCIKSVAEARTALAHGASAPGLVAHMPSGPGIIAEPLIAEIAAYAQVGPYGFDLCNSVCTNDTLDQAKLAAFFAAVRALGSA